MDSEAEEDALTKLVVDEAGDLDVANLQAICAGLGSFETLEDGEEIYVMSEKETVIGYVQNLQQYVRRDDPKKRHAFHLLSRWDVLRSDLLPLLAGYHEDEELTFELLKLLVLLSLPILEKTDRISDQVKNLNSFLNAFVSDTPSPLPVVMDVLLAPLSHVGQSRTATDNVIIELVLTLFRNLLSIPNSEEGEQRSKPSWGSLQEALLWRLREEHVLETFVFVAQSLGDKENRNWNLLLAEIFFLCFRRVTTPDLVHWEDVDSNGQFLKEGSAQLMRILEEESRQEKKKSLAAELVRDGWSRHFRGAYVTPMALPGGGVDSPAPGVQPGSEGAKMAPLPAQIPSMDLLGRPRAPGSHRSVTHSGGAYPKRRPRPAYKLKRRYKAEEQFLKGDGICIGMGDHNMDGRARSRRTLEVLREFAIQFLDAGCYDSLCSTLQDDLNTSATRLLESDKRNFVWLVAFFSGFVRNIESQMVSMREEHRKNDASESDASLDLQVRDVDISAIATTLNMATLQDLLEYASDAVESMDYVFAHFCLVALREQIQTLLLLDQSHVEENKRFAYSIQSNIIWEGDLLNLVISLLKGWQSTKHGVTYLRTLIALNHDLLKMIDIFSGGSKVLAKTKKRKGKGGGESDEESLEKRESFSESEFNLTELVQRHMITPHVIANYCYLLVLYDENAVRTNHHIAAFFHRVAVRCKRVGALFQLSILDLFNRIWADPNINSYGLRALIPVIRYTVRSLTELLVQRPSLYAELCFWKDSNQAVELSGDREEMERRRRAGQMRQRWTDEMDERLRRLHHSGAPLLEMSGAVGKPVRGVAARLRFLGLSERLATEEEGGIPLMRVGFERDSRDDPPVVPFSDRRRDFSIAVNSFSFKSPEETVTALQWVEGQLRQCMESRDDSNTNRVDFSLVPLLPVDWDLLATCSHLLELVGPPDRSRDRGQHCFQRIDSDLTRGQLEDLCTILMEGIESVRNHGDSGAVLSGIFEQA